MRQRSPLITALQAASAAALGAVAGWIVYSRFGIDHHVPLPPAIDADRVRFDSHNSRNINYYVDHADSIRTTNQPPLVLLHSINAAATAYEMRPLFQVYRGKRDVYAIDLPGFGLSERPDQVYSSELFKEAIVDLLARIGKPADVVALSLTSEFAARAALEHPEYFRSLTMISPVGFNAQERQVSPAGARKNGLSDAVYKVLAFPLWSQALFDWLTTKSNIHSVLQKSFAGPVDQWLEQYDYITSHQPGARYAPLYFVSGKLFSSNILEDVYSKLTVPVLVLYDRDAFVRFDRLPELLSQYPNWHAARVEPSLGLPQFERLPEVIQALDTFWSLVSQHHPYNTNTL